MSASLRCRLGLHRCAGAAFLGVSGLRLDRCARCERLLWADEPPGPDPRFFRGLAWGLAYSGCFWAGMTLLAWWLA